MQVFHNPDAALLTRLLQRPAPNAEALESSVAQILEEVRVHGDAALIQLTERFDKVCLTALEVPLSEWKQQRLDPTLESAIRVAAENIHQFHQAQIAPPVQVETMPGVLCWQKSLPIEKVGLYIPGGSAPLFSTVLMLGIPAVLAGCKEVILCTPPQADGSIHPAIAYAAQVAGIHRIFRCGGAQAIAALAYGTASVPRVDKIFGPGNAYVTMAKQLVQKEGVAIDLPAGPSELMVVAGPGAHATFVAADLLSQAEHGADSQVILVAHDAFFVEQVLHKLQALLRDSPRFTLAQAALSHSAAILVNSTEAMIQVVNAYAPEHLILAMDDPHPFAAQITHAGSVFLGHYTPESAGDYASGTNHTLPTYGYARAYSGVNMDAFVKKITYQEISPAGLKAIGPVVEVLAATEALDAHKMAVSIRLEHLKNSGL